MGGGGGGPPPPLVTDMSTKSPIVFYFDFISPYAYLAWTQIHALAARHGREVEPRPILFAALLNAYGHKGPAEIPPKRAYIFKECLRRAHRLGVTLVPPPTHPYNPLLALRATLAAPEGAPRRALIDALYQAAWAGGGGVDAPAKVIAAATAAGLDGEALVGAADAPAIKARLRSETDGAIAAGAFGVPTMIADAELFWGVDSLGDLEAFLDGRDPIDRAALERWSGIEPSASRI